MQCFEGGERMVKVGMVRIYDGWHKLEHAELTIDAA